MYETSLWEGFISKFTYNFNMLFPSKEVSIVKVGQSCEAEFNMVWYTPGSSNIPSDFDLLINVASEITHILEIQQERDSSYKYDGKFPLEEIVTLTDRKFAIALDLKNFDKFVWNDLTHPSSPPSAETRNLLRREIAKENSGLGLNIANLFIVSGTPSKGFITVFSSGKEKRVIHFLFHDWNCNVIIRANVTLEPFVLGEYPVSLVPKDEWPIKVHDSIDCQGQPSTFEEQVPPTFYYFTKFTEVRPDNS